MDIYEITFNDDEVSLTGDIPSLGGQRMNFGSSTTRKVILSALACLFFIGCERNKENSSDTKIVNGTLVMGPMQAEYRSTIALTGDGGTTCTGTLIGPNHVVTAAHCMGGGVIQLGYGPNGAPIPGVRVIGAQGHPRWSEGPFDIAAVAFEGMLPPDLQPVPVAPMSLGGGGVPVIIAGYGVTGENQGGGDILRRTDARIKNFLPQEREFEMQEGLGTGSCYGDSGGPIYFNLGGQLAVIGAVSRGNNCEAGDSTDTDVRQYQGWLKCTFNSFGKPNKELINDASVSDCLPGTIDNSFPVAGMGGTYQMPIAGTAVPMGSAMQVPQAVPSMRNIIAKRRALTGTTTYKIDFSSDRTPITTIRFEYCIGALAQCGVPTAQWFPTMPETNQAAQSNTPPQELFKSLMTATALNAGAPVTVRLLTVPPGASVPQIEFKTVQLQ